MQKVIFLKLILIFFSHQVFSQLQIEWEKNYGGSVVDDLAVIHPTMDDGFIFIGRSSSNDGDVSNNYGSSDYWVVKVDSLGELEWEKNYGGSGLEIGHAIKPTMDGGYILSGSSTSTDGDATSHWGGLDYWILKLDSDGEIIWEKNYGGYSSENGYSIQPTSDGGYVIGGSSQSDNGDVTSNIGSFDYWIVKIDEIGNIEWENSYGSADIEFLRKIEQTFDGGYILAGYSKVATTGKGDFYIVKIDNEGNLEWEKSYGGSKSEESRDVKQTPDGGFVVAGSTESEDGDISNPLGNYDVWIIRLDASGELIWEKTYGGSSFDEAESIQNSLNGGFIFAGRSNSSDGHVSTNNGSADFWIVNIDDDGNILWEKSLGGSNIDHAYSIHQIGEEEFIIGGTSRSDDLDVGGNQGSVDAWIVKLSPMPIPPVGIPTIENTNIKLQPNPSNGSVYVSLNKDDLPVYITVYNSLGQKILEEKSITNSHLISGLSKGIYWVEFLEKKMRIMKQIIIH